MMTRFGAANAGVVNASRTKRERQRVMGGLLAFFSPLPRGRSATWPRLTRGERGRGVGGGGDGSTKRSTGPLTPSLSPTTVKQSAAGPHFDRGGEGVSGSRSANGVRPASITVGVLTDRRNHERFLCPQYT